MWLGITANLTLIAVLGGWFIWWRKTSRSIERFDSARLAMGDLVKQLQAQLATAQGEFAKLSTAAQGALPTLEDTVRRADDLSLEMRGVIACGERIADRIEVASREARAAISPPVTANAQPIRAVRSRQAKPADPADELDAPARPARKALRGRVNGAVAHARAQHLS